MFIDTLVVSELQTNCYIVQASPVSSVRPACPRGPSERTAPGASRKWPRHTAEATAEATEPSSCVLIDPGGEGDLIVARLRHLHLHPELIVNTHGHVDHIGANAELKQAFPQLPIAIGRSDASMLRSPLRNMAVFLAHWTKSPPADRLLGHGDRIEAAGVTLEVREVPGHTPGHIVLLAAGEEPPIVFSGDTVFAGSIGRTDIPGGSHKTLLDAIERRILDLPADTVLYPGHGPRTTVGRERVLNPFLQELQRRDRAPQPKEK